MNEDIDISSYPVPFTCAGCKQQLNRTVGEIELHAQAACPGCGHANTWPRPNTDQIRAQHIQRLQHILRKQARGPR